MCGILGIVSKNDNYGKWKKEKIIKDLFIFSESRGKEASGFASLSDKEIYVYNTPLPSSALIKSEQFKKQIHASSFLNDKNFAFIGHSRLVTDGHEQNPMNNQPFVKNEMCVVHNGIIVNKNEIWDEIGKASKQSDVDTELIPTIIGNEIFQGKNIKDALKTFYSMQYGMTTIASFFNRYNNLLLSTNNGSLYYGFNTAQDIFIFASESHILKSVLLKNKLDSQFQIEKLLPNTSILINTNDLSWKLSKIFDSENFSPDPRKNLVNTKYEYDETVKPFSETNTSFTTNKKTIPKEFVEHYSSHIEKLKSIIRCSKCILPNSFPFIKFNDQGVCNYCNKYQKINYLGIDSFKKEISDMKNKNSNFDCLMPFSGGRDSSFALHFVKEEMGLNPLAFSYDWGMITDLARRNQSRLCGKLGVEHIYISADIRKKRKNIKKNVLAWMKRPTLGTVPLFMAGDKQYFYYSNLLMKQNNLNVSIMGENLLEKTSFKSGFCGVRPSFGSENTYGMSLANKIKMTSFYAKEYILNPKFLNTSIFDTLDAFKSYYMIKHRNINIFNYMQWKEDLINNTLINTYDWETDPGTKTTWRIGDGTAAFYNYIYFMVAGFTENDTFRSNQIREGIIDREEALNLSIRENKPRWDSLEWYCNTIKIDFNDTIKKINSIPNYFI